jgi:hypothetical protein
MREFLGKRVPMDKQPCPEELPCKERKWDVQLVAGQMPWKTIRKW